MDCKSAEKIIHLYIERNLDGQQLEEFLDHVQHCPSCSEELEVNFSIYYALKQLRTEEEDNFDMKELLNQDMALAREHLQQEDDRQFMNRFTKVLIMIMSFLLCGLCIEGIIAGDIKKTNIYKLFHTDPIVIQKISETEEMIEETEQETNHKKEIIVRTPETEEKKEPKMIPDET